MQTQGLNDNSARWVKIINADPSGDDIPAFGVVELAADQDEDGFFPVRKPTSDGSKMVLIAAGANIPSGQKGQASWASPIPCRYEVLDGYPKLGETWGAAAGSWLLCKNKGGFRIFGSPGSNVVNVVRDPSALPRYPYGSSFGTDGELTSVSVTSDVWSGCGVS